MKERDSQDGVGRLMEDPPPGGEPESRGKGGATRKKTCKDIYKIRNTDFFGLNPTTGTTTSKPKTTASPEAPPCTWSLPCEAVVHNLWHLDHGAKKLFTSHILPLPLGNRDQ